MIGLATLPGAIAAGAARSGLSRARRGFSLIELVIVVVIIGIIAAIAVPRMSRGSQGASDGALTANLTVLRNAIDLYQTEHTIYPATGTTYNTAAHFADQLTKYTSNVGAPNATKDSTYTYGPYLRKIPPLPVGSRKGQSDVRIAAAAETPGAGTEAWIYFPTTGEIKANLPNSETDSNNGRYNDY